MSRLFVLVASALSLRHEPELFGHGYGRVQPLRAYGQFEWTAFPGWGALDGLVRWDSAWYWRIAAIGYEYVPGQESSVAFFPAYPLLAKLLSLPLRPFLPWDQAFYLAALVISTALFYVALRGAEQLAAELLEEEAGRKAVWLIAFYPFSFFFSAAYTESLFLAVSVWTIVCARRRHWFRAGLLGLVATATRSLGIFLLPALLLEYVRQRRSEPAGRACPAHRDARLWAIALIPLGLLSFMSFQAVKFSDPLAFVRVQEAWGHRLGFPLEALLQTLGQASAPLHLRALNGAYLVLIPLFAALVFLSARRFGPALGLFGAGALLAPVLSGLTDGIGRYTLVLFPAFLVAASLLSTRAVRALVLLGAPCLAFCLHYFAHWSFPI